MDFLKFKNQTDTTAELYINGDIIDDCFRDYFCDDTSAVFPKDIMENLKAHDGKTLYVHINSGGGHVFAGTAISNYLANRKGRTVCVIDGLAGSIASVIACGCDEVQIPSNAYFMIHKPLCGMAGNADDMRKMADTLDTLQDGILNTYMRHVQSGVTREQINELINKETWLTGDNASEFFNFSVIEPLQAVACRGDLAKKFFDKYAPKPIDDTEIKQKEVECVLAMREV